MHEKTSPCDSICRLRGRQDPTPRNAGLTGGMFYERQSRWRMPGSLRPWRRRGSLERSADIRPGIRTPSKVMISAIVRAMTGDATRRVQAGKRCPSIRAVPDRSVMRKSVWMGRRATGRSAVEHEITIASHVRTDHSGCA